MLRQPPEWWDRMAPVLRSLAGLAASASPEVDRGPGAIHKQMLMTFSQQPLGDHRGGPVVFDNIKRFIKGASVAIPYGGDSAAIQLLAKDLSCHVTVIDPDEGILRQGAATLFPHREVIEDDVVAADARGLTYRRLRLPAPPPDDPTEPQGDVTLWVGDPITLMLREGALLTNPRGFDIVVDFVMEEVSSLAQASRECYVAGIKQLMALSTKDGAMTTWHRFSGNNSEWDPDDEPVRRAGCVVLSCVLTKPAAKVSPGVTSATPPATPPSATATAFGSGATPTTPTSATQFSVSDAELAAGLSRPLVVDGEVLAPEYQHIATKMMHGGKQRVLILSKDALERRGPLQW